MNRLDGLDNPQGGLEGQTDKQINTQIDIVTYRLQQWRGRLSKKEIVVEIVTETLL